VTVFLVINPKGQYWDGIGWSERGKVFLSVATATRSLHEEGEDPGEALILSADLTEKLS
jgi:hypothetical protein